MGEVEITHRRRGAREQGVALLNLATAPEERIEAIDAIRGVALFGVLIVNLVTEFRVSIFAQFLPGHAAPGGLDRMVERVVAVGFEYKAFCLFSLLFGIGLAIQFDRLSATGTPLYWLGRRIGALLLFGLVHLLFVWNGDILTEYAVAGALVLPLLLLPQTSLLFAAAIFFLLHIVGSGVVWSLFWPDLATLRAHVGAANEVYGAGSHSEIWHFSLAELPLIGVLHASVFARTIALFLLGAFLWRTGLFRRVSDYLDEITLAGAVGIATGAALTAARVPGWPALLAPVIFALGYGAALLALAQWPGVRRLLAPFGYAGRMAFTNYLMQSVIFCLIFFGYGLGQFGRMSATMACVLGVAVYAAQIAASRWWLSRHHFGPVERLWRTLMYGRTMPLRRRPC